jgi:hypothetical protein
MQSPVCLLCAKDSDKLHKNGPLGQMLQDHSKGRLREEEGSGRPLWAPPQGSESLWRGEVGP